jgi:hypothetical protein
VAGCLVALLCAGRRPGAGDFLAQIERHPWWDNPPSRADVEALAREVAGARPGAVVYIDGAGKPFRLVPNPRLVAASRDNAFVFLQSVHKFTEMSAHPDGRPLGEVRHCRVEIPEAPGLPPTAEEALGLILRALDQAADPPGPGPPVAGGADQGGGDASPGGTDEPGGRDRSPQSAAAS